MLPLRVLYYGVDEPLPEQIALRAGPLSLVYEAGDLRYICLGQREVVRRIYAAVRDRNWRTVPMVLRNVHIQVQNAAFRIEYDAEHMEDDVDFVWHGAIIGDDQGTICFTFDGRARSSFLRNRIGLCVLHPIVECAGQPCRVEHADESIEEAVFPHFIAPHNPFREIQAISHVVQPGVWAELRFAGEIFEMEDQRNWTDASYKTFGTPLRLPFPLAIAAGTSISQSVTLKLTGAWEQTPSELTTPDNTLTLGQPSGLSLPQLGLQVASHGNVLGAQALAHLRALNLHHLRVDLELARPAYEATLRRATAEARALSITLEVAVICSAAADDELRALLVVLEAMQPPVDAWLIFHQSEPVTQLRWIELARRILSGYDPAIPIGSGTNIYFTQLNRNPLPLGTVDFVCYGINPQVHAFDNSSLVETLAAQAETVTSARRFVGDRPLAVTPVTLRPRFNPDATGPEVAPAPGELPPQVDVRQMSLFGAGWTLGSIKYLAESGCGRATYYETSGWRGVLEGPNRSPLPEQFRSLPDAVFPLYHVLADVGDFAGGIVIPVTSSDTLQVVGLALQHAGRTRLVIANLSAQPQQLHVKLAADQVWVRLLDETTVIEAMCTPQLFRSRRGSQLIVIHGVLDFALRPYAIACIDL